MMNTADLVKIVGQMLQAAGIQSVGFVRQEGAAFLLIGQGGIEIRVVDMGNGSFSVTLVPPGGAAVEGAQQQSLRRALHDVTERWAKLYKDAQATVDQSKKTRSAPFGN